VEAVDEGHPTETPAKVFGAQEDLMPVAALCDEGPNSHGITRHPQPEIGMVEGLISQRALASVERAYASLPAARFSDARVGIDGRFAEMNGQRGRLVRDELRLFA